MVFYVVAFSDGMFSLIKARVYADTEKKYQEAVETAKSVMDVCVVRVEKTVHKDVFIDQAHNLYYCPFPYTGGLIPLERT